MFERRVGQQCSDGVAPVLTDQLLNQLLIAWFSKSVGYRPEEVDIPAGIELSKCRVIIVPDALPGDIGQQPVERCNKAPLLTMCHIDRSEEHTSELQSRGHLVCRLLLEKK